MGFERLVHAKTGLVHMSSAGRVELHIYWSSILPILSRLFHVYFQVGLTHRPCLDAAQSALDSLPAVCEASKASDSTPPAKSSPAMPDLP